MPARRDDFSPVWGRRSVLVVCLAPAETLKKRRSCTIRVCGEAALCLKTAAPFRSATVSERRLNTEYETVWRRGNGLQPQHFPQPFGEAFRHPLEAEVVGMSTIHQTVHAGRT